jgi:hypothetical protein
MTKPRKRRTSLRALTLLYTRRSPNDECRRNDEMINHLDRRFSFVIGHLSFVVYQRYFASR